MDYKDQEEPKKKKFTRQDFKKDVKEATAEAVEEGAKKKKKLKMPKAGKYSDMKSSELRALVNQKKKAILVKFGFPEGKVPRTKAAMVTLCRRLKRRRL
jgi:hypothetical protein